MSVITLTTIPLNFTPDEPVVFSMSWRRKSAADVPSNYTALPDATVDTDGTILDPDPYQFTTPTTTIVVKAVSACGDAFLKTFLICEPVTNLTGTITPVCASGFTLSSDKTYCYKIEEVPATEPSSGEITIAKAEVQYSTCGTYIYTNDYDVDGTGVSSALTTTGIFWRNGGACVDNVDYLGPLNRAGLWATTATSDQDIGFSVCIEILVSKTYYIGLGCDNYAILRLDGKTIIEQDATAIDAQYSIIGSPFKVWHIYPLTIPAGTHIVELHGHNVSGPAALGAEIYDNTPSELAAATDYSDLNLIFSTKDYIGEPVQYGTGGVGYTCPDGFYLDTCEEPYICRKTTTESPETGIAQISFKPETANPGQYKIQLYDNDNLSTHTNQETISPVYPVTVSKTYNTPTFGDYTVKITALACSKIVGQKQINAPGFCSPPRNIESSGITTSAATFSWDYPEYSSSQKFFWEVLTGSTIVDSGSVTGNTITVTGLSTATSYTFKLYTKCQQSVLSTPETHLFTTD